MPHAKSVHTVFVVPVVWLLWSPEPKTANFFVCPHKRAFNTAVIQPYPWSIASMTVLNKYVFLLVVHCNQISVHLGTVWLSGQPCGACGAWKVAITAKVSPSWLTNVCGWKQKEILKNWEKSLRMSQLGVLMENSSLSCQAVKPAHVLTFYSRLKHLPSFVMKSTSHHQIQAIGW